MAMRKTLLQAVTNRDNQLWLEERETGKLQRRSTTDRIKEFVEYAEKQGSRNAKMYYMNISKMENKALFFIEQKYPNIRELMTGRQLNVIRSADMIVEEAIIEGMESGKGYREIYQECRRRVEQFSAMVPRTMIPLAVEA